jgi:hypothetical protein
MPSLISSLNKGEQKKLLEDLNYLNTNEIKTFCDKHSIPYSIWIETESGTRRKTADDDRKGVILHRIRHFLMTGETLAPTCFPARIVCYKPLSENLKSGDRLFYGQYDKKNDVLMSFLRKLTGGRFKNGAIARILARQFWSKGVAPTYQEYAAAWLKAKEDYKRPNPEAAYLSDRFDGKETANWKKLRRKKAAQVLRILKQLHPKI